MAEMAQNRSELIIAAAQGDRFFSSPVLVSNWKENMRPTQVSEITRTGRLPPNCQTSKEALTLCRTIASSPIFGFWSH